MTLLRLAPHCVPLWRDDATLQLGRTAAVVLREPAPWQERVIDALERGVDGADLAALARGARVDRAELDAFLDRVSGALERVDAPRPLAVLAAAGVPDRLVSDVLEGFAGSGWRARWIAPGEAPVEVRDGRTERLPVAVVAAHAIPPHIGAALQREDAPHLPIVFSASGAEVGPLVLPGRTACLSCLAAHERDRDEAWPAFQVQLLSRRAPSVPLAIATEAASLAARLLDEAAAAGWAGHDGRSRSVSVGERSRRRWRSHRPHAECLCRLVPAVPRSRRGSATADAASAPTRAPTTATAFARPA